MSTLICTIMSNKYFRKISTRVPMSITNEYFGKIGTQVPKSMSNKYFHLNPVIDPKPECSIVSAQLLLLLCQRT